MLMEVIIEKKLPLNILASEVSIYPQLLENVRVANKAAARNNEEVKKQSHRWKKSWERTEESS